MTFTTSPNFQILQQGDLLTQSQYSQTASQRQQHLGIHLAATRSYFAGNLTLARSVPTTMLPV